MNYLGHLYFSNNDLELMYANLYGDHFKGRGFEGMPEIIKDGIILHRSIDNYIDHHPLVVELMHSLYIELPKVTGIAIDLFFDHLLAKNWEKFHPVPLKQFLKRFYEFEPVNFDYYSESFQLLISTMRKAQWLNYYPDFKGLQKACEGVSTRLSFPNNLHQAPFVFLKFEKEITECFHTYMSDAQRQFLIKNHDVIV